jgi:glucokinase
LKGVKRVVKKKSQPGLILAGDVGGTNTRLGLFEVNRGRLRLLLEKTFLSKNYKGLENILKDFLRGKKGIAAACFGVAGPVTQEVVIATNLPWWIDIQSLQKALSLNKMEVINDLVANAYGISVLKTRDFETLNVGKIKKGNQALISAGTGLGEAILFWDGKQHVPSPSEGGHIEFGPRNHLEMELFNYLSERFDHVSYERVLSGQGLFHIYQFLKDSKKFGSEPSWLFEKMKGEDPAEVISEMARLKKNKLCSEALDLFASIYGAAAGNLALQVMAIGGVYIGGGIAPKIIWKLKEGTFVKAFKDKGRLSHIVAHIPVKVIVNQKTALLGAASRAANLLKT